MGRKEAGPGGTRAGGAPSENQLSFMCLGKGTGPDRAEKLSRVLSVLV